MRVLLPFYWTIPGGIARVALSLIPEFIGRGGTVVVVVPKKEVDYFQANLPLSQNLLVVADLTPDADARLKVAQSLVKDHQITHCLFMNPESVDPALSAKLQSKISLSLIFHDLCWREKQGGLAPEPTPFQMSYDEMFGFMDRIIVPSVATFNEIRDMLPQHLSRVRCIPHAANVNIPAIGAANGPHIGISEEFTIYYPASAYGNKNHLLLLKAALILLKKNYRFRIILTGWDTARLKGDQELSSGRAEAAREFYKRHESIFRDRIHCLGYCDYPTVEMCYASSNLVVLPSIYEGFGLGLVEAVYRGVPVICSDIEPFLEQINRYQLQGGVRTFPVDDLDQLVAHLEETISGRWGYDLGTINKELTTRTWANVAQEYDEFLSGSVAEHG